MVWGVWQLTAQIGSEIVVVAVFPSPVALRPWSDTDTLKSEFEKATDAKTNQ